MGLDDTKVIVSVDVSKAAGGGWEKGTDAKLAPPDRHSAVRPRLLYSCRNMIFFCSNGSISVSMRNFRLNSTARRGQLMARRLM